MNITTSSHSVLTLCADSCMLKSFQQNFIAEMHKTFDESQRPAPAAAAAPQAFRGGDSYSGAGAAEEVLVQSPSSEVRSRLESPVHPVRERERHATHKA